MSRSVVMATWDDAPHLGEEEKKELWESIPVYQRDARTKGIPQLGSGAIYPISEEDISIPDFGVPAHWRLAYGLDVGWNMTAAVWGAWDQDSDIVYLISEYYRSQAEPVVHATGIKTRGDWIPGVIDRAANGRSQADGEKLISKYRGLGLRVSNAENAVEAGIFEVYNRLTTGRLKVFKSLQHWFEEYRMYRRDENGKIVKAKDHLMDATRYLIISGLAISRYRPVEQVAAARKKSYDPLNWKPGGLRL